MRDVGPDPMQKSRIVPHFLIPTKQHRSEAIYAAIRIFHHPQQGLENCLLLERLCIFPPCTVVGSETKLGQQLPHPVIAMTFAQTQALGSGRRGSGHSKAMLSMGSYTS